MGLISHGDDSQEMVQFEKSMNKTLVDSLKQSKLMAFSVKFNKNVK